jgi:hypothetical protein
MESARDAVERAAGISVPEARAKPVAWVTPSERKPLALVAAAPARRPSEPAAMPVGADDDDALAALLLTDHRIN